MGLVSCSIQIFTIEFDGISILPSLGIHTNQLDRINVCYERESQKEQKKYKGNPVPFSNHQCDFTSSLCPLPFFSTHTKQGHKNKPSQFFISKRCTSRVTRGGVLSDFWMFILYSLNEISLNLRMLSHINVIRNLCLCTSTYK